MKKRFMRERAGVSEVVGALLLIIVVVTAVASISYFLVNAQQNAENRSSYLTDLKNENLQIEYTSFSQASVTGTVTSATTTVLTDLSATWASDQYVYYYLNYTSGPDSGQGQLILSNTADTITTAAFGSVPNTGDAFIVSPQASNQVVLSVRNANTLTSGLKYILVNGAYIATWYQVNAPGPSGALVSYLGTKITPLLIPAKGTEYIKLNYTAGSLDSLKEPLQANQALQITLVSESGNYFTTNWSPPVALASATIAPRDDQAVPQDELSFSGAQSYAQNGTLTGYSWSLNVPNSCTIPTAQDTSPNKLGETLAYAPEALFANWFTDCITGPITATLTVTDSNGFTATSQPVVVPPDPALSPPASLTLFSVNPGISTFNIVVQVLDSYGRPVSGQVVTAVCYGNVTLASNTAGTDSNGQAMFTVTGMNPIGSVLFQVASVPQLEVPYP